MPGYWLAMNTNNSTEVLPGVQTTEPVYGLPATWITEVERKNAEVAGYTVVDPPSVLVTHFSETIKRHCHQILSRQDVQVLLDNLKENNPALVNELVPSQSERGTGAARATKSFGRGRFHPQPRGHPRARGRFCGRPSKNPDELSEQARKAIGAQVVKPYLDDRDQSPRHHARSLA